MTFTPDVYEIIREGARKSAAAVVPLVMHVYPARRVIDVGGGEGWWAEEFAARGCDATCVDESVEQGTSRFVQHDHEHGGGRTTWLHADLENDPLGTLNLAATVGTFDLAVCLEVAEHLSPPAGARLVTSLCALAPVVLFSAAIPGQGGHGHINEQWPDVWEHAFHDRGFDVSADLRWRLWGRPDVEPWYQQNMLVAVEWTRLRAENPDDANVIGGEWFGEHSREEVERVVHPAFYESRISERDAARSQQ